MKKNVFCRLLTTVIMIMAVTISAYGEKSEPENHLGWAFSELKTKFPNLIEIRREGDLTAYAIGNGNEGFSSYYVVKSNVVISEINILASKDELAKNTYDTLLNSYIGLYPSNLEIKDKGRALFQFSTFTMEISYSENDMNIMRIRFDITTNN